MANIIVYVHYCPVEHVYGHCHVDRSDKTGPTRRVCLFCPYLFVGPTKNLGFHPIIFWPLPDPFLWAFASTNIKEFCNFYSLEVQGLHACSAPTSCFFWIDKDFRPTPLIMTALLSFFASFC